MNYFGDVKSNLSVVFNGVFLFFLFFFHSVSLPFYHYLINVMFLFFLILELFIFLLNEMTLRLIHVDVPRVPRESCVRYSMCRASSLVLYLLLILTSFCWNSRILMVLLWFHVLQNIISSETKSFRTLTRTIRESSFRFLRTPLSILSTCDILFSTFEDPFTCK